MWCSIAIYTLYVGKPSFILALREPAPVRVDSRLSLYQQCSTSPATTFVAPPTFLVISYASHAQPPSTPIVPPPQMPPQKLPR